MTGDQLASVAAKLQSEGIRAVVEFPGHIDVQIQNRILRLNHCNDTIDIEIFPYPETGGAPLEVVRSTCPIHYPDNKHDDVIVALFVSVFNRICGRSYDFPEGTIEPMRPRAGQFAWKDLIIGFDSGAPGGDRSITLILRKLEDGSMLVVDPSEIPHDERMPILEEMARLTKSDLETHACTCINLACGQKLCTPADCPLLQTIEAVVSIFGPRMVCLPDRVSSDEPVCTCGRDRPVIGSIGRLHHPDCPQWSPQDNDDTDDEGIAQWKCPSCDSVDLDVEIKTWARLIQDEDGSNYETDADDSAHEWDNDSWMKCRDCGHYAKVLMFVVTKPEEEKHNG